jgi:hypothetical protein
MVRRTPRRSAATHAGGDGRARVTLKAKGSALVGRPYPLPLTPLPSALALQLQASGGACFEARYGPPGVSKNDAGVFKARATD